MSEDAPTTYGLGEGPTMNVSVSLNTGNIEAVRARVGKRGFSAYVNAAIQRQLERDNLGEIVTAYEVEHGALTRDEVEAAIALLEGGADSSRKAAR
ncbi:hypothetical protein [Allostreptomyces psammosilenae]|uniref:CopG family transcriptional regulator n=1 Tax=Allostreptomyces psammosilenae TaxID=1892865 RepID=A0A853A628_9ACTN|nr:hypothetical protein [Allostreptomyces psammosilenae]NYI05932.1 hypothetical protein [Allostreptomyces psammosilenae]